VNDKIIPLLALPVLIYLYLDARGNRFLTCMRIQNERSQSSWSISKFGILRLLLIALALASLLYGGHNLVAESTFAGGIPPPRPYEVTELVADGDIPNSPRTCSCHVDIIGMDGVLHHSQTDLSEGPDGSDCKNLKSQWKETEVLPASAFCENCQRLHYVDGNAPDLSGLPLGKAKWKYHCSVR
jgi:hypothetical protein